MWRCNNRPNGTVWQLCKINGVCGEFSSPLRSLAAVKTSQSWNFIAPHTYIPRKIVFSIWYGVVEISTKVLSKDSLLHWNRRRKTEQLMIGHLKKQCLLMDSPRARQHVFLWSLCQIESASRSKNKWASAFECIFFPLHETHNDIDAILCCFENNSQKVIMIWQPLSCISLLFICWFTWTFESLRLLMILQKGAKSCQNQIMGSGVCLIRFAFKICKFTFCVKNKRWKNVPQVNQSSIQYRL